MDSIGITSISIVFWVYLAIVSVGGMIHDYRKRKLALEPIRMAIEHGQQLSPEVIDRLLGRDYPQKVDPQHVHIGGLITCACGVGLGFLAGFVGLLFPPCPWLIFSIGGVGILAVSVGVGLLFAAKSLRR